MAPLPITVTFRGMTSSPTVEACVQRWATRLQRTFDRIQGCEVVIELPHRHAHGSAFHVSIRLAVPRRTIVISHEPGIDAAHTDVYVAVRDAFRAARRQLEAHARQLRPHIAA